MYGLSNWIEYGRKTGIYSSKRNVRRWINEARGRVPVIDWVNYPDTGYNRREFWRAGDYR